MTSLAKELKKSGADADGWVDVSPNELPSTTFESDTEALSIISVNNLVPLPEAFEVASAGELERAESQVLDYPAVSGKGKKSGGKGAKRRRSRYARRKS